MLTMHVCLFLLHLYTDHAVNHRYYSLKRVLFQHSVKTVSNWIAYDSRQKCHANVSEEHQEKFLGILRVEIAEKCEIHWEMTIVLYGYRAGFQQQMDIFHTYLGLHDLIPFEHVTLCLQGYLFGRVIGNR